MDFTSIFSGARAMQECLARATKQGRLSRQWSQDELDRVCGFGQESTTTKSFEEDPRLMTSGIFSAASFALDLNVDEVLKEVFRRERFDCGSLASYFEDSVAAATGGTGPVTLDEDDLLVCVTLAALSQMDEEAVSLLAS